LPSLVAIGWQIWVWREQPVGTELRSRAMKLWNWRMANGSSQTEMASFGHWFASGLLDPDWSLDRLTAVIKADVPIKDINSVFERALDLAAEREIQVASVAAAYLVSAPNRTDYGMADDAISQIARTVQAPAAPAEARKLGAEIESRLLSRGYDPARNERYLQGRAEG
jgi:hypothetical protein